MPAHRGRRRSFRASRGATAIETAFILPVFLAMVFGTTEYTIYFFQQSAINHATSVGARAVQTGAVQSAADPSSDFKSVTCAQVPSFIDCDRISFDVRTYADMSSANPPDLTFDDDGNATNTAFNPGVGEQITVVRATIPYEFISPWMKEIFHDEGAAFTHLTSYVILRNEPF